MISFIIRPISTQIHKIQVDKNTKTAETNGYHDIFCMLCRWHFKTHLMTSTVRVTMELKTNTNTISSSQHFEKLYSNTAHTHTHFQSVHVMTISTITATTTIPTAAVPAPAPAAVQLQK